MNAWCLSGKIASGGAACEREQNEKAAIPSEQIKRIIVGSIDVGKIALSFSRCMRLKYRSREKIAEILDSNSGMGSSHDHQHQTALAVTFRSREMN